MKQKILGLSVALIAIASSVQAQSAKGITGFGLRAGVNFQNHNGKDVNGNKLDYQLNTGFHAGVTADLPVAPDYFLQPGLLYSKKGAEYANENKLVLSYIELPVNFLYKPVLADGRLMLGFGPYVAYAVSGKYKPSSGPAADIMFEESATSASFRRFDAGANFLAGYELANHLSFQVNAQLGLLDINRKSPTIPNDQSSVKNTGFGISLGYKF